MTYSIDIISSMEQWKVKVTTVAVAGLYLLLNVAINQNRGVFMLPEQHCIG